jgi:hypothetical protein
MDDCESDISGMLQTECDIGLIRRHQLGGIDALAAIILDERSRALLDYRELR